MPAIARPLQFTLMFLQDLQAARFLGIGNGVGVLQRGRVRPGRVLEGKNAIVTDFVDQAQSLAKFGFGLARETDDHVGRNTDLLVAGGLDPGDSLQVFLAGVIAEHGRQYARRAALDRQMYVVAQRRDGINRVDDVLGEVSWMRGREANPADARQFPDSRQQLSKTLFPGGIAVRIHILAEQLNVGVAGIGHASGFVKDRLRSTAALLAASVRHHTIGAELIAALKDGDVSPVRIGAGGEFGLESLVGLAIVESGDAIGPGLDLDQHGRQVAVGSRAGNQGNVGRTLEDLFALLLGDAAENGEALPFLMQLFEIGQPMKDLLLGLVADGAGVVEDQVRIFFAMHLRVALRDERAHDFFGVVEVHLAAEGLDVKRLLLGTHKHQYSGKYEEYSPQRHERHRGNQWISFVYAFVVKDPGRSPEERYEEEFKNPFPPCLCASVVKESADFLTSRAASRFGVRLPSGAWSARSAGCPFLFCPP